MSAIKLTQGKFAVVDDEDFKYLSQWKWQYTSKGYAIRHGANDRHILMHRLIINAPPDKFVDHINMDKLDNRKINLRICTPAENRRNALKQQNNKSGFKGVCFHKREKKWRSQISFNGKVIYIGDFTDIFSAARAYDKKALELHGEFANLNSPIIGNQYEEEGK